MLYHISKLNEREQALVRKAPLLISILITGSDGEISDEEIEKTVKLIHTKAFSEATDIRHLYKDIDRDVDNSMRDILSELPKDVEEREKEIIDELTGLNPILVKVDAQLALNFYESIKKFAVLVAQSNDIFRSVLKGSARENELVQLSMLHKPNH